MRLACALAVMLVACGDNDHLADSQLIVSPVADLHTTEAGGAATFTVTMTQAPAADVSIDVASSAPAEGDVAPHTLVFRASREPEPQTVTITGRDDLVADGDQMFTITLTAEHTVEIEPATVEVTNIDDDRAGFSVSPLVGLVTTEAGGTAQLAVHLTSRPTALVSVAVDSSKPTEGEVDPTELVFTPETWDAPQSVTVIGIDDHRADGPAPYHVILAPAQSTDPMYAGVDPDDVAVTNLDDDHAGVTIGGADLWTSELGDTDSFTVVLDSEPTANVTIALASSDTTEGRVFAPALTFTPATWNVPQTVTVRGVDDHRRDGNIAYAIRTSATSADPTYDGIDVADVAATNVDNETAQVYVKAGHLATSESGTSATFRVRLTTRPTGIVTCPLHSSNPGEDIVSPTSLTFTPGSFGFRTVTVTGVADGVVDGAQTSTIVLDACTSTAANDAYDGQNPRDVAVTNSDIN